MKIVNVEQMREMERRSEEAGVSVDTLMEKAGLAVAQRARHVLGHLAGVPVLVLIGPGNNGSDGLVTARHLLAWGARVTAYICLPRQTHDPKLSLAQSTGVVIVDASRDGQLARLKETLASAHMVIDAVLGTGRARPIEGILKDAFSLLKEAKASNPGMVLLALDIPSGLSADSGEADPLCLYADVTVTLGYPKVGLFTFPGAEKVGRLEIEDIGIPSGLDEDIPLELITPGWARSVLPQRTLDAHKGTFGRALVVAGSRNYIGAAYLACAAAARVGAGLVTLATPQSLQTAVASRLAEATYLPLEEVEYGVVTSQAAPLVQEELASCQAVLVGCGMGQAPSTTEFIHRLLLAEKDLPPAVIDADGLNNLAAVDQWWERLTTPAILTPHPGEMSRLTGQATSEIQADRIGIALKYAAEWSKIVVLKGAYTVIASPEGRARLSPFANPGLASAGTGDVLAGAIAGLLAQGLPLLDAAALGVYLHGAAGEEVRDDLGATGMVASDLLPVLPRVIKDLASGVVSH